MSALSSGLPFSFSSRHVDTTVGNASVGVPRIIVKSAVRLPRPDPSTTAMMKIMFKAVESTVAKGFGGKKDYENPDFRMMMNASAGAPLRSMQISGGMKGGVLPGMLEMANGHFFRGIWRMIKG